MRRFWLGLAISGIAALTPIMAQAGDTELAQQIADNIKNSGRLKGYSISVNVSEGVVQLNGNVSSAQQLEDALSIAEVTPGIERVVNNMSVKAPAARTASAAGLRQPNNLFAAPQASVQRASAMSQAPQQYAPRPAPQYAQAQYAAQPQLQYAPPQAAPLASRPSSGSGGKLTYANSNAPRPMNAAGARPMNYPQLASRQQPTFAPGVIDGGIPSTGVPGNPMPAHIPSPNSSPAPAMYDSPSMPNYAWPSYAAYPNYAAVTYPKQYSASAWPYIGPFYPYPQVPLGWRKVTLEWDDGWWMLDFKD